MKKLLLVDDEIQIFKVIKRILNKNYIIDYAPDGKEGLFLFHKNNYDIIITDYNMPYMNGKEMVNAIRKINNNIPIILITANREVTIRNVKIIYKPFSIKRIKKILNSI